MLIAYGNPTAKLTNPHSGLSLTPTKSKILKENARRLKVQEFGWTVAIAWWNQVNKTDGDIDESDSPFEIISTEAFFSLGLQYSAYLPDCDHRNLVRRFYDLLANRPSRTQLLSAIAKYHNLYQSNFDFIKRICWHFLNRHQKLYLKTLLS